MTAARPTLTPPQRWGLFAAFWTLTALSFAANLHWSRQIPWGQAIAGSLADWYLFAALSVPMLRLARRFQFARAHWGTTALLHVFASMFFSGLWITLRALVGQFERKIVGAPFPFAQDFVNLFIKSFHLNMWIYWVIVAVAHAFEYYRKLLEREVQTAELAKGLTQAKLQALQMQLNPHFLFNTLHTISALMHIDVEKADRTLAKLSDLLRYGLDSTHHQEVALKDEIAFLKRYLEIEQTRFGDRLSVDMDIPDDTLNAQVPNLILQPIVENAIRHGIEPRARPGRIELKARRYEGDLILLVRDNGDGLKQSTEPKRGGIGTSNTRQRLQQLYGGDHRLRIENAPEGGVVATLTIPFREK